MLKPPGGLVAIRLIAADRKALAGAPAWIAALLLLFWFLAPVKLSAEPAASGSASSPVAADRRGAIVLPANAFASERLFGLPGLSNVGRVAPGILRGAQPQPEGYSTLRKMGIRTVVNLRLSQSEKTAVEAAGMRSIEIPMDTLKRVDLASVRKVVAVLTDPGNLPVFVHCAHGKDRTGIVVAVYRIDVDGWRAAEAETEMEAFGFHEIWFHLKKFIRQYPESRDRIRAGTGPQLR